VNFQVSKLTIYTINKFWNIRTILTQRWSVLVAEDPGLRRPRSCNLESPATLTDVRRSAETTETSGGTNPRLDVVRKSVMSNYQNSVADHITQILSSNDFGVVISSAQWDFYLYTYITGVCQPFLNFKYFLMNVFNFWADFRNNVEFFLL